MPRDNIPVDSPETTPENYPPRLRLTVMTAKEFRERALDDAAAVEAGEQPDAVKAYSDLSQLRELLTPRRLDVMESVMRAPPASISALADRLERNYADVHADVELLVDHGIAMYRQDGRAKQPVIPYEEIVVEATLARVSEGPDGDRVEA